MNSFIGWIGGKKLLRKSICDRFPDKIDKYVEVFGGAGWVLFYQLKHAKTEVYNDINHQLVNLFRCIKYHPDAVVQEMQYLLNSREIFNSFKAQTTENLTDIQKAARYLYLIRFSYGSKLGTFGARPRSIENPDGFREICKRLEHVVIENKSFDALMKQYDSSDTLFYCDPPYFGTEYFYDTGTFTFDKTQHVFLSELLAGIKGRFILSYNDCEYVRTLYRNFRIEAVERQNSLALKNGTNNMYKELIIRNY